MAAHLNEKLDEALWWVQRWVSGSMRDPEWDDSWCTLGVNEAFSLIRQTAPCSLPADTVLWRYLVLSEAEAVRLEGRMTLEPHRDRCQSFTTSAHLATEVGSEIRGPGAGEIAVLVAVRPLPDQVMFAMRDLIERYRMDMLADWSHQDEVLVEITAPVPVLKVRQLDLAFQLKQKVP